MQRRTIRRLQWVDTIKNSSKFALFLLILPIIVNAQQQSNPVENWLILGPVETQLPVYYDRENVKNQTFDISNLLDHEPVSVINWSPEEGSTVEWSQNQSFTWASRQMESIGFQPPRRDSLANSWVAFYLETDRFSKITIELSSHHPFRDYVNDRHKSTKQGSEASDEESGSHKEELTVTKGKHLVLIRTLYNPESEAEWSLSGSIEIEGHAQVSQSPDHPPVIEQKVRY